MLKEKRERNMKISRLWLEFGDSMTLEQIGRLAIEKGNKPLSKQRVWQIIEREKTRKETEASPQPPGPSLGQAKAGASRKLVAS